MSEYLPLCAFRQGLLPPACRSCAWWCTTGAEQLSDKAAQERKRAWMSSLENTWGATGLLLDRRETVRDVLGGALGLRAASRSSPDPAIVGFVCFAPVEALPRLRGLPFAPLPESSALVFCLQTNEEASRLSARRLLLKSLKVLRERQIERALAVARVQSRGVQFPLRRGSFDTKRGQDCRFLPKELLASCGFREVERKADLLLMEADLRGLLSLFPRLEARMRRLARSHPTEPSPAAWSRHIPGA